MVIQARTKSEVELAEWMRQACRGDERAYAQFLHSVSAIIRGVIRAKAGGLSEDIQEDILQEVLLAIHSKRDTWRQDHPIKPWVYAIARHKVIDAFRARGRSQLLDISDFDDQLAAPEENPTEHMDVETLLSDLPRKQQTVVREIAMNGLSINETAEKLGMKPTAVRVNFHRGLERLRQLGKED